ncbi:hypothetical protein [Haliangium ochraceum]|uniref:Uncharacterized protein n=1 Tax=Haliangium ochraceum (strain DSM 14365 / JCM 11303 / SMP-2) TaxID=502025 RepID=D0LW36_HALO1|nr:hypothetical protein [Haliangium ochraceum]ACY15968.1 hypothetical protein Hoch_3466 [Haliangium ochraceum DSM 14365]
MKRLSRIATLAAVLSGAAASALAWEAETTHPGLTESAALHTDLHAHLRDQFGMPQGLFTALTVPPADAPELFRVLSALNPTHGYVPDARGSMAALSWLSLGSVVADVPVQHAAHHFFDPASGDGLSDATLPASAEAGHRMRATMIGADLPQTGKPAPDWLVHADNPMGLAQFVDQYEKAVSARSAGERRRHLAGALLAAGAMVHVLQDAASPSHARGDLAAHLEPIGPDAFDRGSRFERIAALVYGRLGVPAPRGAAVPASSLRAFFSNSEGTGLADLTAARWFSAGTLPAPVRVRAGMGSQQIAARLQQNLARPRPDVPRRLDLQAARTGGAHIADARGVCLADYRIDEDERLQWSLGEACMNQQIAAILPLAANYSAALLDWLFRGALAIAVAEQGIAVTVPEGAAALGAGTLSLYWDDARGVRSPLGAAIEMSAPQQAPIPAPPADAKAVAALFRGQDAAGEPLVAAGYLPL